MKMKMKMKIEIIIINIQYEYEYKVNVIKLVKINVYDEMKNFTNKNTFTWTCINKYEK